MSIYDTLNDMQQEAVFCTEGPLLILAGAGSGKTRVLTHRAAYLIEELGVNPYNIMAITFTNKAAGEMRERIDQIVGFGSESIWVSTFHSSCVKILRRYIDRLGYDLNFTIYDSDDQKTLMKSILKRMNVDTKLYSEKKMLGIISAQKNEMISPEQYAIDNQYDFTKRVSIDVYKEYQNELKKNNALDFDDLLVKAVELFQVDAQVLEYYQDRFKYIMVDEYQDTNTVQFMFVSYLAGKHKNLCVVGDDDQSIYKFRGANIKNILNFEKLYPDTRVIKLEQNYRSTGNILAVANEVIRHNTERKEKRLWTASEEGSKVVFRQVDSAYTEADLVAQDIKRLKGDSAFQYGDFACLYRTNAQSRTLEERFISANIPYKIFGGVNFYARKEIKDILAYLKTIDNAKDDIAVKRIINVPKRGIGATTIAKVDDFAYRHAMSFYEALQSDELKRSLGRSAAKLQPFVDLIQILRSKAESEYYKVSDVMEALLEETGYVRELEAEDTEEARDRIENIDELFNKLVDYEESEENPSLNGFLENVALVAEIDALDEKEDYVVLMTIHSAKGLEFPKVYLCGMDDGIFPGFMAINSDDPMDIEEERRLCYVGITRAQKELMMISAQQRMVHGETRFSKVSRFVQEIPKEYLDTNYTPRREDFSGGSSFGSGFSGSTGMSTGGVGYSAGSSFSGSVSYGTQNASKQVQKANAYDVSQFKVKKATNLDYEVGDTVKHVKFGVGIVEKIVDGGRDFEVTVNFENYGIKKMFASFAKLKKQ